MQPGVVLAAATSPTEQAVFDELVHRGVETDLLSPPIVPNGDSFAHVWPVPDADDVDPTTISEGDFVLFYRGGNQYTWAARVERIDFSEEHAQQLMSHVAEQTPHQTQSNQEFSSTLLWLTIPVPIDIDSYSLHEMVDINQKALTRTITLQPSAVEVLVDEYGSMENMIQTLRTTPSVYIEVTSLEDKPYKQPGGEFELGTAAFSRSESADGRDIYETLREPEVGDLVLHFLKDSRELRGVSTVTSILQTDFEGPPDSSWGQKARGDGYYLPLGSYHEFDEVIDIDEDLLKNEEYRPRLQSIYDDNDKLVFDRNFELAQGAYFTECPLELLHLLLAEVPEILEFASQQYWDIESPPAAEQYSSVTEAVVDVRTRLPFAQTNREWFLDTFTGSIMEALTESLTSVQPNAKLTEVEVTHCKLIERVFSDSEKELTEAAERLGVGRTNRLGVAETLFFVLFRELQSEIGTTANMNQVKALTILDERYDRKTPEYKPDIEKEGPIEAKEKPAQGDDIARQLQDVGQMVFYGPPGTGKTYTAKRFAHWWLNEQDGDEPHRGQLETVTFHPSFTYEDFIEGLSVDSTDGVVEYDVKPGVFLDFAERARQEYYAADEKENAPRYVLIIDEINRGNLAQIFGEMITALEADKRLDGANETVVSLAHSGDRFQIPPNLYLIGTMNTADRSIALVDAALRRRFRFLSFPPKLHVLREEYGLGSWHDVKQIATTQGHEQRLLAQSLISIYQLNTRIRSEPDLGRGKQIGHSYLFNITSEAELVDTWRFEILPLLEEYLFGQYNRIRENLFEGNGSGLFDWQHQQIKAFDAETLSTELGTFVGGFDPTTAGETS